MILLAAAQTRNYIRLRWWRRRCSRLPNVRSQPAQGHAKDAGAGELFILKSEYNYPGISCHAPVACDVPVGVARVKSNRS